MRLLQPVSGSFLPPTSVWLPWGFMSDGRMLVEFPGITELERTADDLTVGSQLATGRAGGATRDVARGPRDGIGSALAKAGHDLPQDDLDVEDIAA